MPLEKTVKLDFADHCSINEPMVSLDHSFDVHRLVFVVQRYDDVGINAPR